jgi:predicted RNA binding protein YcfA (HicA-like mRNA interferase family)
MSTGETVHPRQAPEAGVPVVRVLATLEGRGFVLRPVGSHVLATRDGERVVVPTHTPELPAVMVRRLDWSLGPSLGHGSLLSGVAAAPSPTASSAEPGADAGPTPPGAPDGDGREATLVLSAVIERLGDVGPWCTFLLEEPAIMGHGPTPADAVVDVQGAAEAWLGAPAGTVEVREVVRRP